MSIVDSSVSIDTSAAAKLIAFDAEKTGLLYFLYFTTLIIATVKDVKVNAAIAIAVIMWCWKVLFQYTIKKIIRVSARFISRNTQPQLRYFLSSFCIFSPGAYLCVCRTRKK